jgi:DNA-directed RNA polymerase specialized sigma24 family protein
MADTPEQKKARKELRRVQADFEQKTEEARRDRRACFERAQKAGLSLREIAEEAGLHYTRVGEILRDKQKP